MKTVPQQEQFWRQILSDRPAPVPLPLDRNRPPTSAYLRGSVRAEIESAAAQNLRALASQEQVSLRAVLLAAFTTLLFRHTGQGDMIIGTSLENLGGPAPAKPIVVRAKLAEDLRVRELVGRLETALKSAAENLDCGFQQVVEWAVPGSNGEVSPLFNTAFVVVDSKVTAHSPRLSELAGAGLADSLVQCDLVLGVREEDGRLVLDCEFDEELFEGPTVERFGEHFRILLAGMASHPVAALSELPLISPAERQKLLVDWNQTAVSYPPDLRLHRMFETQAERTPDAVAVVFESEQLTYRTLNERANQLAHFLRKRGIGPDRLVGICAERSTELVVGLLGILKAGGAYVPLDPQYPTGRLAFMLEDAGVPVLLTQKKLVGLLPQHSARTICLDADGSEIAREQTANPGDAAAPDNLAYVIYTSGSTGRPKGTMNTHRGICNRLLWMQQQYQLTPADAVMQKTPYSFDVSVWEFFWPLLAGARLVVARPGGHQDPAYLVKLIEEQQITVLHFVPSMLRFFLDEPGLERCRCVRHVICSGEALPFDLQERFFDRLSASLHNLYGPTEAAVDVTHWTCRRNPDRSGRIVPIGRPVANTTTYILDARRQPVPIGVPGELHLGGVQIGRGYHQRPELTAEKFIPDPFSATPGARLYRTGDLARYLPDGNIEFLGRLDHQVKIRGLRIELGEIESRLMEHEAIEIAVVVAREDEPGVQRLIAYLVSKGSQPAATGNLRAFLLKTLPDYMVPAVFVWLKALPLSPNGKVDRQALPAPGPARPDPGKLFLSPNTEMERTLAGVWQKALGVEQVGRDDNFFELGGNSLLLVQVHGKLQGLLNQDLPITVLFQYPTINSLAGYLSSRTPRKAVASNIRQRAERQIAARMKRPHPAKKPDE